MNIRLAFWKGEEKDKEKENEEKEKGEEGICLPCLIWLEKILWGITEKSLRYPQLSNNKYMVFFLGILHM